MLGTGRNTKGGDIVEVPNICDGPEEKIFSYNGKFV